jgi:TusE/DsrC/DsvC family sulfur relay protein
MPQIEVNGRPVGVDDDGYLCNLDDWDKDVAVALAESEMIEMTDEHWAIVTVLREYYAEYQIAPPSRALMKLIGNALGREKSNSKYLYGLFPKGPAKQGCKIAGLLKPYGCI